MQKMCSAKSPWPRVRTTYQQPKHLCVINIILILNPKPQHWISYQENEPYQSQKQDTLRGVLLYPSSLGFMPQCHQSWHKNSNWRAMIQLGIRVNSFNVNCFGVNCWVRKWSRALNCWMERRITQPTLKWEMLMNHWAGYLRLYLKMFLWIWRKQGRLACQNCWAWGHMKWRETNCILGLL